MAGGLKKLMDFYLVIFTLVTASFFVPVTAEQKDENAVGRSYIHKHSSSWQSFALAKDIDKRSKLKKALRDALNSVDTPKSDIAPSAEQSSIDRIQHAALLLKEFQQIHKLSETVKRTFVDFETAKNNLGKTIQSDNGIGILKRFLSARSRRTFVPHAEDKSENAGPFTMKNMILDKPHFLKHTDKLSVIATPLNKVGEVGVEFISVDPKASTPARATKAFKAARILLKYIGSKKTRKDEHIDQLVEDLRNDIDGLYKNSKYMTEKKKKSLLANKASLFIQKDDKPIHPKGLLDVIPTKRRLVQLDRLKDDISSKPTEEKKKDTVKIEETNESANKKSETDKKRDREDAEKLKAEVKEEIKDTSEHSSKAKTEANDEVLENTLKNEETVRTLKDAKLARQKYEIARHELAEKVKELYKMANQYEKDETDGQILEVKNDHIPKAVNITEDNVNVPHTKRDDAHPGVALSGVSKHTIKRVSTATQLDDGSHRAYTMGTIDKKEHQVTVDEKEKKVKAMKVSSLIASKKALDASSPPSNQKVEELHDEVGKNMKTQEESLKVIAEAIKDDMKDIANVNKKKKLLTEAMSGSPGEKKDQESSDKIDEYLTKSLSDIMGSDATYGSDAGKEAEHKLKERVEENKNTNEQNMKIVAEAMKSSNAKIALPLISKEGDKISLNKNNDGKSPQRDTNDIMQHVSDHDPKKALDFSDPSNKALLDKAIHLEEQVAAQQDKLYKGQVTTSDEPAKPNIAVTPDHQQASSTGSSASTSTASSKSPDDSKKGDAYGSIKETMENPEERQRNEEEDDYDDDDDEDDDYDDRRRHHHSHRPRYDDDEDEKDDDDDDEEDDYDKRGHVVRYHDENDKKRSFKDKPIKPTSSAESNNHTGQPHYDDLEDVKRSSVPRLPKK